MQIIDLFRKLIKEQDACFSKSEQEDLWNAICVRTESKYKYRVLTRWCVGIAASIFIVGSGLWLNSRYNNPEHPLISQAELLKLENISLYIGDESMELPDNSHILCNADRNYIEVSTESFHFKYNTEKAKLFISVAVPAGKRTEVTLCDGTHVMIRENSQMTFPMRFESSDRKVNLRGEAYMKVAHDRNHPFLATTEDLEVKVLGTEFLLSDYPGQEKSSVMLLNGSVEVKAVNGNVMRMKPGETYVYNASDRKSSLTKSEDVLEKTFWKENIMNLNDEPLSKVLHLISIRNGVHLDYDKDKLNAIRINGKLDISVPIEQLLNNLQRIAPISINSQDPNRIEITLKKK